MCLQKYRHCFLNSLQKSWESLVSVQLPYAYSVVFGANETEKERVTTFYTKLPKNFIIYNDQTRKSIFLKYHATMTNEGNIT